MNRPNLTERLDELLDKIDDDMTGRPTERLIVRVGKDSWEHDALGLARAVSSLIDFGGGNLKLPSGRVFRLNKTCVACETAVPMRTHAGLDSKFCRRCANYLADMEWERQEESKTIDASLAKYVEGTRRD